MKVKASKKQNTGLTSFGSNIATSDHTKGHKCRWNLYAHVKEFRFS